MSYYDDSSDSIQEFIDNLECVIEDGDDSVYFEDGDYFTIVDGSWCYNDGWEYERNLVEDGELIEVVQHQAQRIKELEDALESVKKERGKLANFEHYAKKVMKDLGVNDMQEYMDKNYTKYTPDIKPMLDVKKTKALLNSGTLTDREYRSLASDYQDMIDEL